jgi:hypothetical protein
MGLLSSIKFTDDEVPTSALRDPIYSSGLAEEFGRGVNSGLTGAHAGLRAVAGTVGEALGADQFAKNQYLRALELERQAQAEAPRVNSYKQVNDLRSGAQYVTGLIGGSMPSMALGVGAGLGARTMAGALLRGTAAQTPIEAGDVALKQLDDPNAMAMDATERGLRQLGGGLGSAALQSVVPATLAGKLMGRGAQDAAQMSWKQVAGRNALGIPVEGLAEGGGDIIKQQASNENAAIDWESVKENTIGGMAAGGAMSTVGTAADLAYRNGPMAADALSQARTSIKDKLASAKQKSGVVLDEAGDTAGDMMQKAQDFYEDAKPKVKQAYDDIAKSDYVKRTKNLFDSAVDALKGNKDKDDVLQKVIDDGEVGIDPEKLRTASPEQQKSMFDFSDNEKLKAVKAAGEKLMNDVGLDEDTRAAVAERMGNLTDKTAQVFVAQTAKARQATTEAAQKIKDWYDRSYGEAKKGEETAPPSSWDIDGEVRVVPDTPEQPMPNGATAKPVPQASKDDAARYEWTPATGDYADDINAAREAAFNDRASSMKVVKALKTKMREDGATEDEIREVSSSIFNSLNPVKDTSVTDSISKRAGDAFGNYATGVATDAIKNAGNSKRSEDMGASMAAVISSLKETGIANKFPQLFEEKSTPESRKALRELGMAVRDLVEQARGGKVKPETIKAANDVLGPHADEVVNSVIHATYGELGDAEAANVIKSLGKINKARVAEDELRDSLSSLSVDRLRIPPKTVQMLVDHARGDWVPTDPGKRDKVLETATDAKMEQIYRLYFGDQTDAARNVIESLVGGKESQFGQKQAISKDTLTGEEGKINESDDRIEFNDGDFFDPETGDRMFEQESSSFLFGITPNAAKDKDGNDTYQTARYTGNDAKVLRIPPEDTELIDKIEKKVKKYYVNTDTGRTHEVKYDKESQMVVATQIGPRDEFTDFEVDRMRFDETLGKNAKRESPSRLVLGGKVYDAAKITAVTLGLGKLPGAITSTVGEGNGRLQRLADAFKEGLYRLAAKTDSEIGNIDPDLVIGYVGKEPVKWSQIQRTNLRKSGKDGAHLTYDKWGDDITISTREKFEMSHRGEAELRKLYLQAFGSDARLKKLKLERIQIEPDLQEDFKEELTDALKWMSEAKDKFVQSDQQVKTDDFQQYKNKVEPVVARYAGGIAIRRNVLADTNSSSIEFSIGGQTYSYPNNKAGGAQLRVLLDSMDEDSKKPQSRAWRNKAADRQTVINAIWIAEQPHSMKDQLIEGSTRTISAKRIAAIRKDIAENGSIDRTELQEKERFNADGILKKKAATADWFGETGNEGRYEAGKDENVHIAAVLQGEDKMERLANMDGSPKFTPGHRFADINPLIAKVHSWDSKEPGAEEAKQWLAFIVYNMATLSENDQKALARLVPAGNASKSGIIYNSEDNVTEQFADNLREFESSTIVAEIESRKRRLAKKDWAGTSTGRAMQREIAMGEKELARREANGDYERDSLTPQEVTKIMSQIYETYKGQMTRLPGGDAGTSYYSEKQGKHVGKRAKVDQTAKKEQMRKDYEAELIADEVVYELDVLKVAKGEDAKAAAERITNMLRQVRELRNGPEVREAFPSGKSVPAAEPKLTINQKASIKKQIPTTDDLFRLIFGPDFNRTFTNSDKGRPITPEEFRALDAAGAFVEINKKLDADSKPDPKLSKADFDIRNSMSYVVERDSKAASKEPKKPTAKNTEVMQAFNINEGEPPSPKAQAPEQGAARFGDKATLAFTKGYRPDLSIRLASKDERASIDRALGHISMHLGEGMPPLVGVAVVDGDTNFAGKAIRDSKTGEMHMLLSAKVFDDVTKIQDSLVNKDGRVIFHEVGHLFDYHNGGFTNTAPELQDNGLVVKEIAFEAEHNPIVKQWFGFTLNHPKRNRETFAQAFALYILNPKLIHEILPETYTFISATIRNSGGAGRPATNKRSGEPRERSVLKMDSGELVGVHPDASSVSAKKQAAVKLAKANDPKLLGDIEDAVDPKQLQRLIEVLADKAPETQAMKRATERLREMIAADESVAYGMQTKKYSLSNQQANGPAANAAVRKEVKDYIEKVLGKSVKLHWAKLTHAGDFTRTSIGDIIQLSLHSLNPKSVAYHESLHAFFAQLRDANAKDIIEVIEKAASKPEMVKRLMAKFANQPAVLNQLQDPEERAAYMFQLWAEDPKGFPIATAPRTAMEKVVAFIHRVLGTWSNDQRALHIMEYFHSGEYAKNMGKPNEVRRALMDVNRNGALETAKEFTMPLYRLGDAIASTGDARIRDLNIPAFNEIVDLIKRRDFSTPLGSGNSTVGAASRIISGQVYTSNSNGDNGFIPAARMQATKRLNNLADRLAGYTQTQLDDALESLQSEKPANSAEGRLAAREIKAILKETYEYMTRAGVKIGNLGPDYFPRVWDTHYISKNEQAFRDMMEPYVQSGEFKGNVTDLILGLTSREGNEFGVETSIPGMQHKKQRLLSFIKAEDAAPFLTKDLYGTLGTYITQATRRAEWDRRFGFNVATGKARMEKFYEDAKAQGAKDADFELLEKYFKSVDGTLGDDLNPKARRLMGNVMVYQNIRLLPMAAFSMMVDPLGILVRGGTAGEAFNSFKRGMASIPRSYGKKYTPDEAEKLAEMLGVVENAILSNAMGDAYTQGMVGGGAKKWNQLFFKYNAVEGLNRSFRVGATEAAISFIKRHADGKASPHSKRWMDELGLQAGDVKVRPDGRLAVSEKDGLTKAQVYRVHAAVNMWVDGAVLRPNAADKPIWMNDPHWALIAHLKQFVWSFQETILKRAMHELEQGNFKPAMALVSYVPVMIAVDTAKGILQNGGDVPEWKKDWDVMDYTNYGIERAGLYGVGQFGNDVWSDVQRGGVGIGALAGPTIDQISDAVQATGGNKEFAPFVLDAMPANALYSNL